MKKLLIHPEELTKKWVDRMVENDIGILGIHPVGGRQAYLHLANMLEEQKKPEVRALYDYAAEKGLKIEYGIHAAGYLLPRALFAEHPEYFRVDENGERNPDLNFCFSNKEAMELFLENTAKLAKQLYGSSKRYFLWLDDAKDAHCHCPECRKLSPSDQQMTVLNAMVRRLRKDDPEASLAYLAYVTAITPPETVKPEEGIFLEYAPYERKMDRPVSEMPESEIENLKDLLAFFGKENSVVLEYWYDNSLFSGYKKPPKVLVPNNDNVRADLDFYRALGFEDLSSFACYLGDDYDELFDSIDLTGIAEKK